MPRTSLSSDAANRRKKVIQQQRNVGRPLAERRQLNRETAQAVIQIGPKLSGGDHLFQIAIRGGDHPHVGGDGLIAADPLELLLLEHAQHLGLQQQRHIANFVEKQRAAVALLEFADAPLIGAGEGAPLVAKQLAFQQRVGNGGAVDGQKRLFRARAEMIDARATSSLPVPLSPRISTVTFCGATRPMAL